MASIRRAHFLTAALFFLSGCSSGVLTPTPIINPSLPEPTSGTDYPAPVASSTLQNSSPYPEMEITPSLPEAYPGAVETQPVTDAYPSPNETLQPTAGLEIGVTPMIVEHAPPPRGYAFQQTAGFHFIDKQHGWLLGSECNGEGQCQAALRKTGDGGITWESAPAPAVQIAWFSPEQPSQDVHSIQFLNESTGWLFGPGLWITQDGGRTWSEEKRPGEVNHLLIEENWVWAVEERAGQYELQFYQGEAWQAAEIQPGISAVQVVQLISIGKEYPGILIGTISPEQHYELLRLNASGAGWETVRIPCLGANPEEIRLEAVDSTHLWLLCGFGQGARQQQKTFYTSPDGGTTWTQPVDMTGAGYVGDLDAFTAQVGFIGFDRSTLFFTTDGGQVWKPAIDLSLANPGDASGWELQFFEDGRHGWAALQDRFFRTEDGGATWVVLSIH